METATPLDETDVQSSHPMHRKALTTLYVPIIQVVIQPTQNANKPAIEKTTRIVTCPVYMFRCFKEQWGHTAAVSKKKIVDKNDLWKVPQMPGFSVLESEMQRVKNFFPKGLFKAVFPTLDDFESAFAAVVREDNPHVIAKEAEDDENREAGVALAARGVIRAATDAANQAKRKAATRKPKPETPAEDA